MPNRTVEVELRALVSGYVASLRQASSATQDTASKILALSKTERDMESAISAAGKSLAANGIDLRRNTDAGQANRAALDNIAVATRAHRDALVDQGASVADVTAANERGMQAWKASATAMGASEQEVEQLSAVLFDASGAVKQLNDRAKNTSGLDRLAQSAETNRAEWTAVGTVLAAVGAGTLALVGKVASVGIEYNTLQQQSRAALTTLLGGTEAANAQMDKLDTFARTSPFSKQVFIQAQQQMIAFGIATAKVIPYMQALNDATAAAGGTGQTLGEIAFVMAQISAAGKITGQDLIQFGQRGINAAELIGSAMGKSGAEIRSEITAGTLDANDALDALAAGMATKYGGAAANVKQTWIGATDRISAAWRDMSSSLVDPFVGKEGGGALVEWANRGADAIRLLEGGIKGLPDPVKMVGAAMLVAAGGAAVLSGGIALLAPRLVATKAAAATLTAQFPRLAIAMNLGKVAASGLGIALTVGIAALALYQQSTADAEARTSALADTLEVVDGKVRVTAQTFDSLSQSILDAKVGLFGWGGDLVSQMDEVGVSLADVRGAIVGDADAIARVEAATGRYYRTTATGQQVLTGAGGEVVNYIRQQSSALSEAEKRVLRKAEADKESGSAAADHTEKLQNEANAAREAAQKMRDLTDALWGQANAKLKLQGDESGWQQALDDTNKTLEKNSKLVKKNGGELSLHTQAGRDNARALRELVTTGQARIQGMIEEGSSADKIAAKTAEIRTKYIAAAKAAGYTAGEAKKLADQYGLIPSKVLTEVAASGVRETQGDVHTLLDSIKDLPGKQQVEVISTFLDKGIEAAEKALNKIDKTVAHPKIDPQLTKSTVTVKVVRGSGGSGGGRADLDNADGGILALGLAGIVQQFASGGFGQPQVRPFQGAAGVNWGEQGSGPWEAFISGAPQKKDRSIAVWREVGHRLLGSFSAQDVVAGFADGGIAEPSWGGKALSYWQDQLHTPLQITQLKIEIRDLKKDLSEKYTKGKNKGQHKLKGLDRTEAIQKLAEAEAELDLALKAQKVNADKLGSIANRLASYEQQKDEQQASQEAAEKAAQQAQDAAERAAQQAADAAAQLASTSASNSASLMAQYMQGSSAQDLIANMAAGAQEITKFQNLLAGLQTAGLNASVTDWLMGKGTSAADLAQQILAGGQSTIDFLNTGVGQLRTAADALGAAQATGNYTPAPVLSAVTLPGYMQSGASGAAVGNTYHSVFQITQSDPYAVAVAVDQQFRYLT